jgi:hypothetical protein
MLNKNARKVLHAMERMALQGAFTLCKKYSEDTENDVTDAGRRAGFKYVAGGAFSQVFESPAVPGMVVKVTTSEYDGYHDFVRFVMERGPSLPYGQQRYLPVIYSSEVICGVRITLMERLDRAWCLQYGQETYDEELYAEFSALKGRDDGSTNPDAVALHEELTEWMSGTDCAWDLHRNNVMLRDGELVITDPWSTYKEDSEASEW